MCTNEWQKQHYYSVWTLAVVNSNLFTCFSYLDKWKDVIGLLSLKEGMLFGVLEHIHSDVNDLYCIKYIVLFLSLNGIHVDICSSFKGIVVYFTAKMNG